MSFVIDRVGRRAPESTLAPKPRVPSRTPDADVARWRGWHEGRRCGRWRGWHLDRGITPDIDEWDGARWVEGHRARVPSPDANVVRLAPGSGPGTVAPDFFFF